MKKYSGVFAIIILAAFAIMTNIISTPKAANPSYTASANSSNVIVQGNSVISKDTLYTIRGTSDSAFILKGYTPKPGCEWIWAHPTWTEAGVSTGNKFIYYIQAKNAAGNVIGSMNVDTQNITGGGLVVQSVPAQQIVIPFGTAIVGSQYDFYVKIAADSLTIRTSTLYQRQLISNMRSSTF
jgi:hypothetical protein